MILRLDAFLIARLEKQTQRFQRLTGKTNFWICGKCTQLVFAVLIMTILMAMSSPQKELSMTAQSIKDHPMMAALAIAILLRRGTYSWRRDEAQAFRDLMRGLSNYRKIRPYDIINRYLSFGILVWSVTVAFIVPAILSESMYYAVILLFVQDFLEACDPLPPCAGKISEKLQAFFARQSPAQVGPR